MITFPPSPSLNQVFTSGTKSWQWDGSAWLKVGSHTHPESEIINLVDDLSARILTTTVASISGNLNTQILSLSSLKANTTTVASVSSTLNSSLTALSTTVNTISATYATKNFSVAMALALG